MIDFQLTETDKAGLARTRAEALFSRKYARFYDENEGDFPPEELPEAKEFFANAPELPKPGLEDTGLPVMSVLHIAGQTWGDYSVRLRRPRGGGLGNAALAAAGTPEQAAKWRHLVLAMAITEPGCGSDPSRVQTTAELDGDEWVINGEKIFVTTGIRAEGAVIWATIDRSAGTAPRAAPGSSPSWSRRAPRASMFHTKRRSSVFAPTTPRSTCFRTAGYRGKIYSEGTSRSPSRVPVASAA
jgi:acyl-CoA dehydrogenase